MNAIMVINNFSEEMQMRTEEEMISLIKDVANNDENIRAAYMEGSRTNPNAPKDIFQDGEILQK